MEQASAKSDPCLIIWRSREDFGLHLAYVYPLFKTEISQDPRVRLIFL